MKNFASPSMPPNKRDFKLQGMHLEDVPLDWSWSDPQTLASLNLVTPLLTIDQMPAILKQPGIQIWGIYTNSKLQGLYFCKNHAQHNVMRLTYIPSPNADRFNALIYTYAQLTQKLLSSAVSKISVYLLESVTKRLWPLLRHNAIFFLEGRLRQVWQPALQRSEDVFVLSALGNDSIPPLGSLWLNASARSGRRFFTAWPSEESVTALPESPIRGQTLIDTGDYQLRTLTAKDASDTLVNWLNSPQLISSMNLPRFNYSLTSVRALLASFDRNFNQFIGIFKHGSDQLIGFYTVLVNEHAREAQLALCVYPDDLPASRIMVDTITPLTDSFFERFAIQKITGNVLVSNRRMLLNLAYNFTFLLESILRQECQTDTGRSDVAVFSTFRDHALRPKTGHFML
ncbi:hypothetical protein [Comamonas sp. JUb58]|uniref:GNAT family N-acetyltransferase n=1 Tax=Comamonas sp. JUb58 TaxID=2485114 RepID=UPI00105FCF5B|nr:hypothetical protein [Comamonas sp. JUb58]TDS69621.1 RimJ/RimL family protein N-acetyltransferase [Comamonas sp. JUb58]